MGGPRRPDPPYIDAMRPVHPAAGSRGLALSKTITLMLTSAFLAALLILTLGGFYQPHAPVNLVPFRTILFDLRVGGRDMVINFFGNLVAFLPVGVLVPSIVRNHRPALSVA